MIALLIPLNQFHYELMSNLLLQLVAHHLDLSGRFLSALLLLWHEDSGVALLSHALERFHALADYQADHLVGYLKF